MMRRCTLQLSRCSLCRHRPNLCRPHHTAAIATASISPSIDALSRSGGADFSWSSYQRHLSSSFRNSLVHNQQQADAEDAHKNEERESVKGGRGNRQGGKNNDRRRGNQRQNQRPKHHSVRLIGESAARSTTQQILDAFGLSDGSWANPKSLLAAEQALEFWAHRNNSRQKRQGRHSEGTQSAQEGRSALEGDAEMALRLFTALHHFHMQDGDVLNNAMYSHVVDALAKSPNSDHVQKADVLLRQFIALYLRCRAETDEDEKLLGEIEDGSLKSLSVPEAIEWNDDTHHLPNQIRITGVMRGHARQFRPKGAESLLRLMMSLSSGEANSIFRPNEVGFGTGIDAFSRIDDGMKAEQILQLMKKRHLDGNTNNNEEEEEQNGPRNGANIVAYNSTISAWARTAKTSPSVESSRDAAENAKRLLREMWSEHEAMNGRSSGRDTLLPDVVTYSAVMSAYANCHDQPYGRHRARELLTELEDLAAQEAHESRANTTTFQKGGGRHPHGFQPNDKVYNTILQACVNAGDASAAESILQTMISLHASSSEGGGGGPYQRVRPSTLTFNVVLNAWSKSGGGDAGVRASAILDQLEDLASSGDNTARPDIISYNTVLSAWSKSARVDPSSVPEGKEGSRNSCIVGKRTAYEAMKLLDKVERRYIARSKKGAFGQRRSLVVKPDAISYNTTIAAFANAAQHCNNGTSTAEQAEALLSRMKERMGIEPDDYSYNGVLLAWARCSGGLSAAKRAESILRSMKEPTLISWSSVITAYAHADDAPKAESLLCEMEQDANDAFESDGRKRDGSPDVVLYNNVLHAWSRSSDADASRKAEGLLARMEDSSELPTPTANSYGMVLNALEHSSDHDKAERGKALLDRFLASFQAQTVVATSRDIQHAYNSVLTACAYTPGGADNHHRNVAVQLIVETFRDMSQFQWPADGSGIDGPNQESYSLLMQGCIHLFNASEERDLLLKAAFRECCRRGMLNNNIWAKLCTALGSESTNAFIKEMISRGESDGGLENEDNGLWHFDDLPKEWIGCS